MRQSTGLKFQPELFTKEEIVSFSQSVFRVLCRLVICEPYSDGWRVMPASLVSFFHGDWFR